MITPRVMIGAAASAALLAAVIAANFVTGTFGLIPVGFGLEATAGTFFAGFALAARDGIQDALGKAATVGVILAAAGISYVVADARLALASAAALLLAELADFAVYTPLRERARFGDRRWAAAVILSGIVGAVVDTVVFIGLAFGAAAILGVFAGQLVGKTWATLSYLIIGKAVSHHASRRTLHA